MGLTVASGNSNDLLNIDQHGSAQALLYGADGNPLVLADRSPIVPGVSAGIPIMGRDGPVARVLRVTSNGGLRAGDDVPLFFDSCEGALVDINKWIQTATTMTVTQAVALGMLFNAASSVSGTVGIQHVSHTRFPFIARNGLLFRCRALTTAHFNNNLIELGFGAPATATTTSIGDGACWRKDGSGQWVPVLTFNSGTDVLGTPISDATFRASVAVTEYAVFEVFLEDTRATFRIVKSDGSLVNEQVLSFGATVGTFGVTRLQAMLRIYNSAVVSTAVQMRVAQAAVWLTDAAGPSTEQLAVWNNNGSLTSPTLYTQLANYANSTVPGAGSLSNTAAGYTTPGGLFTFAAITASEVDNALFAFQVPAPFGLTVQRVRIDAINLGAAVATSATVLQWGLGFNSSAVSLATAAPYAPMKKGIGFHTFPIGAAIGASGGPSVVWQGREKVQPGRFLHIIVRCIGGTATPSQTIRGTCAVDGFFE